MADNRKESKENQTRWIFEDAIVKYLIEALEASKIEYKVRGLDFEGDLVKLYSELRVIRSFFSLSVVFLLAVLHLTLKGIMKQTKKEK